MSTVAQTVGTDGSCNGPRREPYQTSAPPSRPLSRTGTSDIGSTITRLSTRSRANTLTHQKADKILNRDASNNSSNLNSQRSSWDTESFSESVYGNANRSESFGQAIRARTSKLWKRRQSKHARATASLDPCDEKALPNHIAVLPAQDYLKHTRFVSAGNNYPGSRPHISIPYNFQHLTHTHSRQFKSLDKASEEELASELSAIQTAQTPQRRLQGITAQDLSAPSSACPSPSRQAPWSPVLRSPSSIYSTCSRFEQCQLQSPPRTPSDQDYFSHHTSHFANSPEGTVVPPRKSSRAATHIEFYSQLLQEENIHSHDKRSSGLLTPVDSNVSPYFTAPQTPLDAPLSTWVIPHAMTTPDDSAYTVPPASRHASLADVPEEDDSKSTMIRESQPSTPGAGLRHTKSFPNTAPLTWQQIPHSPILGNPHTFSALGGVDRILPAFINQSHNSATGNNRQSRQIPYSPLGLDASWEDDIDFCYEHAAEANCDFDWTRPSLDDRGHNAENDEAPNEVSVEKPEPLRIRQRSCSSTHQLPRLQTSISMSNLSLTNSANSSIVSVAGPTTPANPYILSVTGNNRKACIAPQVYESECFNDIVEPEHPIVPEADFKHPTEELFALHTFRFDPPPVEDDSPRSSRSPISKANSYESFWSSRPSLAPKYQGNNVSADSLPDLIKSKRDAHGSLQSKKPTTPSHHHTRAKSEAIKSTATPNAAFNAMRRKRSASSTRGSSYSLFPPVPAMKVIH